MEDMHDSSSPHQPIPATGIAGGVLRLMYLEVHTMNQKQINTDRWDDDSVVVNFDLVDLDKGDVVGQAGYVHIRMEDNAFTVTAFNADGDVVSETHMPFDFKG
jgi:hypothetical protein